MLFVSAGESVFSYRLRGLMMKRIFWIIALLVLSASSLWAQDISGDWQGAIGAGKGRLRAILHIDKADDGRWKATFFSIDQDPGGMPVTSITQQGAEVAFSIAELKLSYKGTLSADGRSIVGTFTQGGTVPLTLVRATEETAWPHDIHCSCTVSFVPVGQGVKLEVLDWGGTGRPLVLLAGLGDTAHGFDKFAAKLVPQYHVYGITRRGYGESGSPLPTEANYSADRLGDDVVAVIDALHLKQRPVLVGHSIAGEELSSVGSRHPEKVAGLVYLDAAYGYAFYDHAHGGLLLDALEVRKKIEDLATEEGSDKRKAISDILAELPDFEKELQAQEKEMADLPTNHPDPAGADDEFDPGEAILLGQKKYKEIKAPVLAIFADPHDLGKLPREFKAAGRAAMAKYDVDYTDTYSNAFEAGGPTAHVVRIPNADHYVFQSNEAQVLKEMDAFLAKLPN
jgi:pimeloyl-ACP methyl ester carboxylesterase